jgi:catechol 2,3-dioxygenase-like lactoylglutathione lyase family enzyme
MKLNLLVLRTANLEELRTFYTALGARFEMERHGSGPVHYAAKLHDDFVLELYPCSDPSKVDAELRLGIRVDNIFETLKGIEQSVVPKETRWGLRALVRDPDGRTVELIQGCGETNSAETDLSESLLIV